MMRAIHKHEIPVDSESHIIELVKGSRPLHVEYVVPARSIFLWVEVDTDVTAEKQSRKFKAFKTGDGVPLHAEYVGSAIDQYTPESYHVYELAN